MTARPIGLGLSGRAPRALRPVLKRRRVQALVATLQRGSMLRPAARFVASELAGRRVRGTYAVRGSGVKVVLEHATPDVNGFDEIFFQDIYAPPPAVVAALAALHRPVRIVDIGANIGLFGAMALTRWPEATITAFEPDPRNAKLHRAAIAANGRGDTWQLEPVAAAAHNGTLAFAPGRYALSGPVARAEPDAIEVAAIDILPRLADADLIKLDAEGSEWAILGDARFAATDARAIALEYHPILCPGGDARATAVGHLEAAGFTTMDVPTRAPGGYGSLWAWRPPDGEHTVVRAQ